ncbi:MAG: hypothetical protein AAFO09_01280 [Pseudomonadota bacterium]
MSSKTASRLTIDVSPDFRDELKIQAIAHGKTLKDYVVESLMNRIKQDSVEEDKIWGEMSKAAKREEILSHEDSTSLLNSMKNA